MDVTLKKAAALRDAALAAAGRLKIETTVAISIYSKAEPSMLVSGANSALDQALLGLQDLVRASYALRRLIGQANADKGINDALTARAEINLLEKKLVELLPKLEDVRADAALDEYPEHRAAELRTIEAGERPYDLRKQFRLSVVTDAQVEALKKEIARLQRQRSELSDWLAGTNLNHRITVPSDVETTLKAHGLID